jgi:hypothetical protein
MKKGKYIDYNILLACLSKKPKANPEMQPEAAARQNVVLLAAHAAA